MNLCTGYSRLQLVILNFLGNKTPLLNFYFQVFSDWSAILTRIMPNFVKLMRRFRDIVVSLQRRRRRQRERQKSNRFILAKQQLCTCTRFLIFVHFLASRPLHDYNVKVPNSTFCRGQEHKTTIFFFFYWTLIQSFRIQLQKNLATFDELNKME